MNFKDYCYLIIYIPKFLKWAENRKHTVKTYRVIKQFDWYNNEYMIVNTPDFTEKDMIEQINDDNLDHLFEVKYEVQTINRDKLIQSCFEDYYFNYFDLKYNKKIYITEWLNYSNYIQFEKKRIDINIKWNKVFKHFNFKPKYL